MAGGDRLSELPDDLIRRVLHFAPAHEAASTSALSRRWRSLWRTSAAVNLETRAIFGRDIDRLFSHRDAFASAAKVALDAAAYPVTRLTFCVEVDEVRNFLCCTGDWSESESEPETVDVVEDVLSHPASCCVEELRISALSDTRICYFHDREVCSDETARCTLGLGSLPSETLRVLDLNNCEISLPPVGVAFPRLASLRLTLCVVPLEHLQGVIDAAPALAAVHLDSVFLAKKNAEDFYDEDQEYIPGSPSPPREEHVVRLRCPAATVLVLDQCGGWSSSGIVVEIDAPRLRRFRYKGHVRKLSLNQQAPDLARVDLHFFPGLPSAEDPCDERAIIWQVLQSVSNAKELKLTVKRLEDIAVVDAADRAELLCAFRSLERLELEGIHSPKGKTAAVAIANLLRCCPVLRDLRINLRTVATATVRRIDYGRTFLQRKFRDDLDKSIDHFLRRRLEAVVPPEGEGDGDDDANYYYVEVSDVPALSRRSFRCLQGSLRRVSLQFQVEEEELNCFGVRMIRFFAENAMVLEEMRVDSGNRMIREHINRKIERWVADSSRKMNTSFVVLPLER